MRDSQFVVLAPNRQTPSGKKQTWLNMDIIYCTLLLLRVIIYRLDK